MSEPNPITDVTGDTFVPEVLDASRRMPVLVDFWADWCQPCKKLAPLLETVAREQAGKLKFAKVNTDHEQQLAAQLGIRNLPTVVLFKDGQAVDHFSGLIPKAAIDEFLGRHLLRESDGLRRQAQAALAAGDRKGAINFLRSALVKEPDNYHLHPELAGLLIAEGEYEQAEALLNALPANEQLNEDVARIRASLKFLIITRDAPDAAALRRALDADNNDVRALYQLSAHQVIAGEYEAAMDQLLDIVRRDRRFGDDAARKALIDVFTLLGNSGDQVKRYRSRLAGLLN